MGEVIVKKLQQKNIPQGWERKKLSDLGRALIGLTYAPHDVVSEGGVLVLRSSNIQDGKINYDDQVRVSTKISDKNFVKNGDILICARNGSRNLIGKNAYISKNDEGNAFGAFMSVFRSTNPRYIYQLFQSSLYKKEIERDLGPTINQVTTGNLSSFKFNFPQVSEQNRIVAVLETWDKAIEKLAKKIEIKKAIKKGLIRELLTGQKRLAGFKDKWQTEEFLNCFNVLAKVKGEKKSNYLPEGIFPIIDQSQSTISGYSNNQKLAIKDNFPFIIFGDHTRILKLINFSFVLGNDGTKVFQGRVGYDTNFLFYLLNIIEIPNTWYNRHFKFLKEQILYIPKSQFEQKEIANILIIMDKEVSELSNKLSLIKDQKKYLLNNIITGSIRTPETLSVNK
jgi:type I restriction enzyme S subunit